MRRATALINSLGGDTKFQSTLSMRRATTMALSFLQATKEFQSTLSMRRATRAVVQCHHISLNFNPRSP